LTIDLGERLSVDRVASGRETSAWRGFGWTGWLLGGKRALGKASHRGHGGHRGELELWARKALGGQAGFWAGNERIGEGIAQRSRRSQRGNWRRGRERLWVDRVASWREPRAVGKASHRGHGGHRGESASWMRGFGGQGGVWAGTARIGESIAQRSRRSQRGNLVWWTREALGGQGGFWAGTARIGESIAQRSRRGIGVVDAKGFGWTGWLLGGKRVHW
jgi:hypothetical protein